MKPHHVEAKWSTAGDGLLRSGSNRLVTRDHADAGCRRRCDEQGQGEDKEKRAQKSHHGRGAFFAE